VDRDEYRRMAENEDKHWWYAATRALLQQELEGRLPVDGRFLDAGGGTGATCAWLAEHGELVASDFVVEAMTMYRELHPGALGYVPADVQHQPFADGSFDAVTCIGVLCHRSIPDPLVAVGELARVVRPGGIVCMWEPGVRRLRRAHDRVTHTARRFSLAEVRSLAERAGLQVERATGAYSFLVPPAAIKAVLERGRERSDLGKHEGGLGGVLARCAAAERAVLRRTSLPTGLALVVIARRPA
jgi:ubiquinone/menaquinone biosynthesis C-methylase UbiE